MSQAWGTRPSDLLDLEDRLAAFLFDEAVHLFGAAVQGRMDEAEAKAIERRRPAGPAVKRALEQALGLEKPTAAERGRHYEYDLTNPDAVQVRVVKR